MSFSFIRDYFLINLRMICKVENSFPKKSDLPVLHSGGRSSAKFTAFVIETSQHSKPLITVCNSNVRSSRPTLDRANFRYLHLLIYERVVSRIT